MFSSIKRAAIRASADRAVTAATGIGGLLVAMPMRKPTRATAMQATAGTLLKLSAISA